jgi:uncharacterized protein YkwD
MKKNVIATILSVTLIASLALSGCGIDADNEVNSTEITANTEEAFVEGEDLSEESTEDVAEDTEAEDAEAVESEAESEDSTESAGTDASASASYTYADMSKTMYAKSSVNVRDLPSTDGNKLGGLSTNQEVTVTGQCNETSWYRIEYKGSTGYVSNKYLSDEKVATTSTGSGSGSAGTSASAGTDASVAASTGSTTSASGTAELDGFYKDVAQQVWAKVNAERSAAGLNTLAWDDSIYEFACQRAKALVTDFSHNGCGSYGENILFRGTLSADDIHNQWYNSQGHHDNYMYSAYTSGACAVYYYNGTVYAVEDFYLPSASKSSTSGETYTVTAEDMASDPNTVQNTAPSSNSWTASNGVTVYDMGNGILAAGGGYTGTQEEWNAAVAEYYATH